MRENNITYLVGDSITKKRPCGIFDDIVCKFLNELSKKLRENQLIRQYPDVLAFAFYCRKANISRLKEKYMNGEMRFGLGLAFHIAPGNVPVNFAFSYIFGLLSGCANVVRVSTKQFPQVDIICEAINAILENSEYENIKQQTAIIRYDRDKEINDSLSKVSDVRIIWGGDATIKEFRKSETDCRCRDITFADRYSFGMISTQSILGLSDEQLGELALKFYNDTYLMDQNACSTPHLICWIGGDASQRMSAKKRFWQEIFHVAQKYDLAEIKVSDKYVMLCEYAAQVSSDDEEKIIVDKYENFLYVISLKRLPDDITKLRGKYGLFFQYDMEKISEIALYVNKMVQSCLYYGIEKNDMIQMIQEEHLLGIDRVVEFGNSLDIGVIWDGHDIIREMSRVIECR